MSYLSYPRNILLVEVFLTIANEDIISTIVGVVRNRSIFMKRVMELGDVWSNVYTTPQG